jgi:hypothetical protein
MIFILFNAIEYKAAQKSGYFISKSICSRGTSQRCFSCGKDVKKSLAVRTHTYMLLSLLWPKDRRREKERERERLQFISKYQKARNRQPATTTITSETEGVNACVERLYMYVCVPLTIAMKKSNSQVRSMKQEAIGFTVDQNLINRHEVFSLVSLYIYISICTCLPQISSCFICV